MTGVAGINRAMGAIGAVGVVATAECSCNGLPSVLVTAGYQLSSAQHRTEHTSSAHHRLRFTRVVRVCGWGRGQPCSR
jgi:hypothetical protein